MNWLRRSVAVLALVALVAGCGGAKQQPQDQTPPTDSTEQTEQTEQTQTPATKEIILATTTSTQDSGLLDVMIPMFEEKTGYTVKTIAVGTGQALKLGENGEADVLLVHAPDSEKPLVESGVAINRRLVMHNDFILIGPPDDPAGVKETTTAADAFAKIAEAEAIFVSRGDDSGTHKKELSLWEAAGVEPTGNAWYQETGQGMGATITVANEKQAYCLTDRATYLAQKKNINLEIVSEGDAPLLNIYHIMEVNPEKYPMVNHEGAKAFADFFLSEEGQETIRTFGVDTYGEPLFFPDGGMVEEDLTGGK